MPSNPPDSNFSVLLKDVRSVLEDPKYWYKTGLPAHCNLRTIEQNVLLLSTAISLVQ